MTTASHPAASEAVSVDLRGDALWITLARPKAMNALSHAMLEGIEAALAQSLQDGARCVVITGEGRGFCAGADLKFVNSALEDPVGLEAFLARASGVFSAVERHPLPVIAAINGTTVAGGLELALACDIIVAAESATIADGHATFGLLPGAGGAVRLPRRIGTSRAKLLLFTGGSRTAREMEAWGLVDVVAPDDQLQVVVQQLCEELASRSPLGLRRMKQVVNDQESMPIDRGLRMELDACGLHLRTADVAEGLAAFAERRAPVFPGR
jgi:enoyl-CoA hydratase/carnithine racemase